MAGTEKKGDVSEKQFPTLKDVEELLEAMQLPPLMVHLLLVLFVGWIAACLNLNILLVFTLGFAYLFHVERRQKKKFEAKIRSDERRSSDRKRLLSDAETVRWLNYVVECVWPVFMEKFASEHFLMRLAPFFLEKFKPWTAKKVVLQELHLGRTPPVFTLFRAGHHPTDGDHLVLEMTMNFSADKDMKAAMAVQMKKRIGLGIWTSFFISDIQVEGNVKVGVRFVKGWPVIGRVRICFSNAPIIRMVAKPVSHYGVDVTDLPGIAAWLDKMIIDALEQSLVEPNLLVVDVVKLVGDLMSVNAELQKGKPPETGGNASKEWYSVAKRGSIATLVVEILEAERLKPCDPNGKSDPYVKIVFGETTLLTSIKKKTLSPNWHEHYRIPIISWKQANILLLRVRDKDRFRDDELGFKKITIDDIRDGERHDMWLALDGVKTGRLHVALTVDETPSAGTVKDELDCNQIDNDAISEAASVRETGDFATAAVDEDEVGSDFDETPLKNESQPVDVGYGQPGGVSLVNPGKHVVKEAYSSEKLRQQKKPGRGLNELERRVSKTVPEEEMIEHVEVDLANEVKQQSRMRKLLHRRKSTESKKSTNGENASPDELSDESNELVVVGNRGTEMRMTLDLEDDQIDQLEGLGVDDTKLVPEMGDSGRVHHVDMPRTWRGSGRSSRKEVVMKNAGKMVKQAGKTAHHAFRKFHSGRSESDSLERKDSLTQEDNAVASERRDARDSDEEDVVGQDEGRLRVNTRSSRNPGGREFDLTSSPPPARDAPPLPSS